MAKRERGARMVRRPMRAMSCRSGSPEPSSMVPKSPPAHRFEKWSDLSADLKLLIVETLMLSPSLEFYGPESCSSFHNESNRMGPYFGFHSMLHKDSHHSQLDLHLLCLIRTSKEMGDLARRVYFSKAVLCLPAELCLPADYFKFARRRHLQPSLTRNIRRLCVHWHPNMDFLDPITLERLRRQFLGLFPGGAPVSDYMYALSGQDFPSLVSFHLNIEAWVDNDTNNGRLHEDVLRFQDLLPQLDNVLQTDPTNAVTTALDIQIKVWQPRGEAFVIRQQPILEAWEGTKGLWQIRWAGPWPSWHTIHLKYPIRPYTGEF